MKHKINVMNHGNTYVPPPEEDTLVVELCPECQSPDLELDSQWYDKVPHHTFWTTQHMQTIHCKSCKCQFHVNIDHKRIHVYPETKAWTLYTIGLLFFIGLFIFLYHHKSVLGCISDVVLGAIYGVVVAMLISDYYY